VPIVAMTANARAEDRQACIDAGMDGYVSKPIDMTALATAIEQATAAVA
jgi:CheY-like chemotaxis protein